MTLSALASTFGGIVRPICFAAFRLMTNSNFVGCSTGKSLGLRLSISCPHTWQHGGTHGIKPGISLSFVFNGHRIFLRWPCRHGPVWAFSGQTPEPASPVQECSQVSSPSGITHQLLNSMCENEENITQLLEGRNDKVDCPIASRFCFRMPSTSESSFL